MMNNRRFGVSFSQWAAVPVFLVLMVAALYLFVSFAEPPERKPAGVFTPNYGTAELEEALTPQSFHEMMARIQSASMSAGAYQQGRLSGSPGFYNTEKLILDTFKQAGLKVDTQEFEVVVPVTEYCEILDASGKPLSDVKIYPFEPNGLIPTVLPKEGVTGNLVLSESSSPLDVAGKHIEDSIVVNNGLDTSWSLMASLGVKALIVREDAAAIAGDPGALWQWNKMQTPYDIPYARFLSRGPVEKYAGQKLRIRCKVAWQSKKVRNIIGVLSGDKPSREALVITSFYDSSSMVPDLAPGGEQAMSLAAMLNYVRALAPYKGHLKRDVVFVAVAGHSQTTEGAFKLMEAAETFSAKSAGSDSVETKQKDDEKKLGYAKRALEVVDSSEPWSTENNSGYKAKWWKEDPAFRKWFEKCFETVAGEINLEIRDMALPPRLEWTRIGRPAFRPGFDPTKATEKERVDKANRHPLLQAYLDIKDADSRASNAISTPFWMIAYQSKLYAKDGVSDFEKFRYRERAREYFNELIAYHTQQIRERGDTLRLRELIKRYDTTLTLCLELYSGGTNKLGDLAVLAGRSRPGTQVVPQSTDIRDAIAEYVPVVDDLPKFTVTSWSTKDADAIPSDPNIHTSGLESEVWFRCGRLAFTVVNKTYFPSAVGTPTDTFERLNYDVVNNQVLPIGKAILAMANGRVTFKQIAYIQTSDPVSTVRGTALASVGTSSLVPSHPMVKNTFVHAFAPGLPGGVEGLSTLRGVRRFPIMETNPYGEFYRPFVFGLGVWGAPVAVDGFRFGDDGTLMYAKDTTAASQAVFKNEQVPGNDMVAGMARPVNLSFFRCSQVTCYQRVNPKTLGPFATYDFLTSAGLQPPDNYHMEGAVQAGTSEQSPAVTAFLPPDCSFYVAMLDGSAANPEIQSYRAFMLNVDPKIDPDSPPAKDEPELYGRGYLAADTPNITFSYFDAAQSMLRTNGKRLRLLKQFNMADDQMIESQKVAEGLLAQARETRDRLDPMTAVNLAGRSLSFTENNHPVIRTKVSNSIVGIIWYLGLLVPFVFFFEKLVFGFTDIRKQLVANGIIFVGVFMLLRVFLPAFQMVRSPIMILLGFLVCLLSLIISIMVTSKFQSTIKVLRAKEGHVEGADINRGGVIGTAFMLGLNNMRRRKVRTGFTCVTLILITFVMICFTSVSTDVLEKATPTGHSFSNGLFRRNQNFLSVSDVELSNIDQIYGWQYPVSRTYWLVAYLDPQTLKNINIQVERRYNIGAQMVSKSTKACAAMTMQYNEPLFSGIDRCLVTKKGWFPNSTDKNYVILPDERAKDLGITAKDVNEGEPKVMIRGAEYIVRGIVDSALLTGRTGMDGQSILPYDMNGLQTLSRASNGTTYIVPENVARLKGSQVIITSKAPAAASTVPPTEQNFAVSCSVLLPGKPYRLRPGLPEMPPVSYREQRQLISEYLERTGTQSFYAIDGMAYEGSRARGKEVGGLIEMLIPILLASMTVFNTMRGSVYERREEIYVYNAVGIAPNHIFFMFMAEACVYAVIGAMAGYLLSQIVGTVLTMLHVTGGLNMDYSAIETIYASLAIVAAVLFSTLIPARAASRLALPSDEASWTLPTAEGDLMNFTLPFTFTPHDRVAVISYFHRWLDANGEGSSGSFYCAPPRLRTIPDPDEKSAGGIIPGIESTVWLKPYDLGVSQKVQIFLPTDPETGEFIARITLERLSGTISAWNRTVLPFLTALRKQFLNWRAVSDAERAEMFEESKMLFTEVYDRETV